MAHTSEQTSKEGGHNSASTGAAQVGSTNAPPATNVVNRQPASHQNQTPTTAANSATGTSQNHPEHEDKEYDPSAEALIDDIDDERTLEEEEAMAGDNSTAVQNELDDLKRESEMPIEELLAYYQRMREAEGDGDEEEEEDFVEDEDEEDDMEDEDGDEVRKRKQSGQTVVKNGGGLPVPPSGRHHHSATDTQTHHSRPNQSPTTTAAAPQTHQPQVADPSLANTTHLSSTPTPSQLNAPKQRQHPIDLNDVPAQDTQISSAVTPDATRHKQQQQQQQQQSNTIQQNLREQPQPGAHQPAVQEQTISIECIEEPNATFQDNDAQSGVTAASRHRRSMTEFLVDGGNAPSSILKTFLDYDLDDSDDLDEDYSYTDDENIDEERDWRRVIHVGPEHQAQVPETLALYENDLPPYENQDTLVWRCDPEQSTEELIGYLKCASTIPRRNDISISPASVPKISSHNMRLYRERIFDIEVNRRLPQPGETSQEHSEISMDNIRDVYMSQSRKRLRIDSELEQENAMDGLNQAYVDVATGEQAFNASSRDENSNSLSQDTRPEISTEEYYHGEEQLLYLLLQCNHNTEEALRRRRLDPFKYYIAEPMSLWSQDECLGFEQGLRTYGKNFFLIRETNVPTRTRAEIVAFYYLWKKSERHDVYTTQYKLDRKRSLTHPGTTDYMDKFIEDNESVLNASSTHTPTPTESTVEANQMADVVQHDVLLLTKCPESASPTTLVCPADISGNAPRDINSVANQGTTDGDRIQEGQIFLDGNTAI